MFFFFFFSLFFEFRLLYAHLTHFICHDIFCKNDFSDFSDFSPTFSVFVRLLPSFLPHIKSDKIGESREKLKTPTSSGSFRFSPTLNEFIRIPKNRRNQFREEFRTYISLYSSLISVRWLTGFLNVEYFITQYIAVG